MLRMAHRRWICLAKLLLEAEQGNWTASLCRVAFLNRSQKFSNSSSSSSDVFSKTAITSVVTMLYTTKNEGWEDRQRLPKEAVPSLPSHDTTDPTQMSLQGRRIPHPHTNPILPSSMPPQVPNYPPFSCDYLRRKLNGLPIFNSNWMSILLFYSALHQKQNTF